MAREKDTRVIYRGVTITDDAPQKELTKGQKKPKLVAKTYSTGDEDALERRLTAAQIAQLKAKGAIDGNWIAGGPKQDAKADAKAAADKAKADKAAADKAAADKAKADAERGHAGR